MDHHDALGRNSDAAPEEVSNGLTSGKVEVCTGHSTAHLLDHAKLASGMSKFVHVVNHAPSRGGEATQRLTEATVLTNSNG